MRSARARTAASGRIWPAWSFGWLCTSSTAASPITRSRRDRAQIHPRTAIGGGAAADLPRRHTMKRAGDDAERSDEEERRQWCAPATMQSEAMRRSGGNGESDRRSGSLYRTWTLLQLGA
ncbi:cytochrome P450 superfamily protein [Mycobacterium xenopi 4042]|uniref:Cytochrome P450 superfamily protein n=1 Tax=Mycobacterium xenopi 4042 TaxID=1299334 RepID=X8DDL8_MYCXE|nr:cytochrome P450 superfamily protein [Mycobacterium xenopi 4042]